MYKAKHVIVTLPIGVLKNSPNFFSPRLNIEKVQKISHCIYIYRFYKSNTGSMLIFGKNPE